MRVVARRVSDPLSSGSSMDRRGCRGERDPDAELDGACDVVRFCGRKGARHPDGLCGRQPVPHSGHAVPDCRYARRVVSGRVWSSVARGSRGGAYLCDPERTLRRNSCRRCGLLAELHGRGAVRNACRGYLTVFPRGNAADRLDAQFHERLDPGERGRGSGRDRRSISLFVNFSTHVIIDVNGYYASSLTSSQTFTINTSSLYGIYGQSTTGTGVFDLQQAPARSSAWREVSRRPRRPVRPVSTASAL